MQALCDYAVCVRACVTQRLGGRRVKHGEKGALAQMMPVKRPLTPPYMHTSHCLEYANQDQVAITLMTLWNNQQVYIPLWHVGPSPDPFSLLIGYWEKMVISKFESVHLNEIWSDGEKCKDCVLAQGLWPKKRPSGMNWGWRSALV